MTTTELGGNLCSQPQTADNSKMATGQGRPTMRTLIRDLTAQGQEVTLKGWMDGTRNSKNMLFLVLRDETGFAQISLHKPSNPSLAEQFLAIPRESAVIVTGTLQLNEQVKLGGKEVVPTAVEVAGLAASPLPIDGETALDQRLDWRFLDLRRPTMTLVFAIQTTLEHAMREWWMNNGFLEMHSPKLMGHASESGAELFSVPYFGQKAYLAQSPQFYKQMAMAAGWGRVFEIGPVFRANDSNTVRHDTEFTSVDMEISWVESHDDVMRIEEEWLAYILKEVKNKHGQAILERFGIEVIVPTLPFPRVTMQEALHILKEVKGHVPDRDGDLDPRGERLLCEWAKETHGHEFIFVKDWPAHIRAFYHMRDEAGHSKSFDLLWRGTEITTGAQREHRVEILTTQAVEKGIKPDEIGFYLDFFRYGMPPHGGFGLGLTRLLMLLTGLGNVREVTYLYRGPTRLTP